MDDITVIIPKGVYDPIVGIGHSAEPYKPAVTWIDRFPVEVSDDDFHYLLEAVGELPSGAAANLWESMMLPPLRLTYSEISQIIAALTNLPVQRFGALYLRMKNRQDEIVRELRAERGKAERFYKAREAEMLAKLDAVIDGTE